MSADWYRLANEAEVFSPALVVYPDRAQENIRRMIRIAGQTDRLRPHVKTHKLPELLRLCLDAGLRKFKCATLAEAEMSAQGGAPDVLWAYQPVGPNLQRCLQLVAAYPQTRFTVLIDDPGVARDLSATFRPAGQQVQVLLDVDVGQHRTGIEPGPSAVELYRALCRLPALNVVGLHAYDGHLHDSDPLLRSQQCEAAFARVTDLKTALLQQRLSVPAVIVGGSPTFPFHAKRPEVECTPGTPVLWDYGYASAFADLDFLIAATLLTRVVSRPKPHRLCLDLGHKAVAAEMPQPRVHLPDLPDAQFVAHNEEHLVVESPDAARFAVGDVLYAWPKHICPTVNLHSEVWVARNGKATERWQITARARRLSL